MTPFNLHYLFKRSSSDYSLTGGSGRGVGVCIGVVVGNLDIT